MRLLDNVTSINNKNCVGHLILRGVGVGREVSMIKMGFKGVEWLLSKVSMKCCQGYQSET